MKLFSIAIASNQEILLHKLVTAASDTEALMDKDVVIELGFNATDFESVRELISYMYSYDQTSLSIVEVLT